MRSIPARIVASSPGTGCRWMCAFFAVSVRRGSITISLMPRLTARWRCQFGLTVGMPPSPETAGFVPMNSHVSAASNGVPPPSQRPWSACAWNLPGWSIEPQLNVIGEPSAFMNALESMLAGGASA